MKQTLFTCRWVQGGYHAEGKDSESEAHFSVLCCRLVKKKQKKSSLVETKWSAESSRQQGKGESN